MRLVAPAAALLAIGCAELPLERVERDRLILAAVEPCREKYAELLAEPGISVRQDGGLHYWYKSHLVTQTTEAEACFAQARKGLRVGPWAPARLSKAAAVDVALGARAEQVLVPVRINGVPATLLLAPKSGLTYVRPAFAQRADLRVGAQAPTTYLQPPGAGSPIAVPFVRARMLEIGAASVEGLDLAVYENPKIGSADGILGANVLERFHVNVDRRSNRLRLEPKGAVP